MIKAVGEYIAVIPEEFKNQTDGGLLLPDEHVERAQFKASRGEVVSIGSRAFVLSGGTIDDAPKVGDTVIFQTYEGASEKGADGTEYRLIRDDTVMGVIS